MADVERRLGLRPRYGAFDAAFDAHYVYDYLCRDDGVDGPAALPKPVLPDFKAMPLLLSGAFAATVVGLAESSDTGAAYPNSDGSRPDMSRDFSGQGLGNLFGAFFQAMPAGGAVSRTGIAASSRAQTRWG